MAGRMEITVGCDANFHTYYLAEANDAFEQFGYIERCTGICSIYKRSGTVEVPRTSNQRRLYAMLKYYLLCGRDESSDEESTAEQEENVMDSEEDSENSPDDRESSASGVGSPHAPCLIEDSPSPPSFSDASTVIYSPDITADVIDSEGDDQCLQGLMDAERDLQALGTSFAENDEEDEDVCDILARDVYGQPFDEVSSGELMNMHNPLIDDSDAEDGIMDISTRDVQQFDGSAEEIVAVSISPVSERSIEVIEPTFAVHDFVGAERYLDIFGRDCTNMSTEPFYDLDV